MKDQLFEAFEQHLNKEVLADQGKQLIINIERVLARIDYNAPMSFHDEYDQVINSSNEFTPELITKLIVLGEKVKDFMI